MFSFLNAYKHVIDSISFSTFLTQVAFHPALGLSKINMSNLWEGKTFMRPFMEEYNVYICMAASTSGSFPVSQGIRSIRGSDLRLLRPSSAARQRKSTQGQLSGFMMFSQCSKWHRGNQEHAWYHPFHHFDFFKLCKKNMSFVGCWHFTEIMTDHGSVWAFQSL